VERAPDELDAPALTYTIDLDDLRRAGKLASDCRGPREAVVPLGASTKRTDTVLTKSAS
jgi:hypothetical protein